MPRWHTQSKWWLGGVEPDMTTNNHSNNLNTSNMYDMWVINYCVVMFVRVNSIIMCDSDYMEYVPSVTSEHKFWNGLLFFLSLSCLDH
jgi:hypothetical protein